MKMLAGAGLVLVLIAAAAAAAEPGFGPPGSYRATCKDVHMEGNTLVATCQAAGGRWVRSSLPAIHSCVGDIGNANGRLACNYR
jgi:hypothetical protein